VPSRRSLAAIHLAARRRAQQPAILDFDIAEMTDFDQVQHRGLSE
jgi:hypothetical protein